jgi:hypothetical protein
MVNQTQEGEVIMFKDIKKKRFLSLILTVVMVLGLFPAGVFAADSPQVTVNVENTTYVDGAPWTGRILDIKADITEGEMVANVLTRVFDENEITAVGLESNYISSIDGLAAFGGGGESGWMYTINDWFSNMGVGEQTVADGDVIAVQYTTNGYGGDLGGSWDNNDKTVKDISFSEGELSPAFDKDTKDYTLTVESDTTGIVVTPTASNKNFQVRTSVAGTEYKRGQTVPISDGTVITVKCGDPSWPTMNIAEDVPAETYTITVDVAGNNEVAKLESLIIHTSTNPSDASVLIRNPEDSYSTDLVFDPDVTSYTLPTQNDSTAQLRFRAKPEDDGATVTLYYGDGESKDITWTSGASKWANCLQGGRNEFTIVVNDGDKAQTTYTFKVDCEPTLTALTAKSDSTEYYLDKNFAAGTKEYTLAIPTNLTTIELTATPKNSEYTLLYNGQASSTVDVSAANTIEVVVSSGEGENKVSNTYTINLSKSPLVNFKPTVTPGDALFKMYDQKGNPVAAESDGSYNGLFDKSSYTYTATKYGYVGQTGEVPAAGGEVNFNLEKAADDGIEDVDAYWKNFRNSDANLGITDAELPIVKEDTSLLWNKKIGTGWADAPSVQIIVDNALVVMVNKNIYKLDLETGETLATGEMVAAPDWGYTPPIYAEGMIFAPLTNGTIQAFNAKTLESVWVYQDELKGQSLSSIAYSDGYIYTGFWKRETESANFVCLSVTDEDPLQTHEAKIASWKHTQPGGFYWAGAVVIGDAVIVGTDDGQNGMEGPAKVYSFNKYTGEILSELDVTGDQRSSIAYDKANGKIYFTTKCGYLYSASVNAETGALSNLKGVKQVDDNNADVMSTSTPVVYGGKVYIGVGRLFKDGWVLVADAESLEKLFTVSLQGYPQCSMLLTTAFEDTGYLYLYSTYNFQPGGISMIKIKTDATKAEDAELIELYDAEGFPQQCITSIICGPDGTLYYKNDSCNVFAVGVPKVTKVINLINAIGTVTLDSDGAITKARTAYDSLSEAQKEEVTNYTVLTTAEEQYELLVAEEQEGALATAKTNAKNELDSYKNPDDYRDAQKDELADAITVGKDAIDKAADIQAVNSALAAAKAEMDKVKTDAQFTKEEQEEALATAKTNAKNGLNIYKDPADYRDAQKSELADAVAAGKEAIDAAEDIAGVDSALATAKTAIGKIKTKAQLIVEEIKSPEETVAIELDDFTVLSTDALEAIKESGKNITFVKKENERVLYSWTFDGSKVDNIIGDIDLSISFTTNNKEAIDELVGDRDSIYLSFAYKGELPAPAFIKVYVGDKYEDGEKLNLYYFNEKTKKAEEIATGLEVKDGYVSFTLTHMSDYFLTKTKIAQVTDGKDKPKDADVIPEDKSIKDKGKGVGVATGDTSPLAISLVVFSISLIGVAYILIRKRRTV